MTPEQKRADRRAAMPQTTALMEQYAEFSPTLIYASENGHSFGKPPEYVEVFDIPAGYNPSYQAPTKERK